MYHYTGWEKFTRYHDLKAGCVLTFSYLGERDMTWAGTDNLQWVFKL
jgi:hypothetical protein